MALAAVGIVPPFTFDRAGGFGVGGGAAEAGVSEACAERRLDVASRGARGRAGARPGGWEVAGEDMTVNRGIERIRFILAFAVIAPGRRSDPDRCGIPRPHKRCPELVEGRTLA